MDSIPPGRNLTVLSSIYKNMVSTGHKNAFSETKSGEHTILLPADKNLSPKTSTSPEAHQDTRKDSTSEEVWKPNFNRRQSWSREDQKHEMQRDLMGPEKRRYSGYSETLHKSS